MLSRKVWNRIASLAGFVGMIGSLPAGADQVIGVDLETSPVGGVAATVPQKLKLTAEKPKSITKEPEYHYTPVYGVIALGDAKSNEIVVVLDTSPTARGPRLYVDGNGNGDLTDDPPIMLTKVTEPVGEKTAEKTAGETGSKPGTKEPVRLGAEVPVMAHYNIAGRAGQVASSLRFVLSEGEMTYNRSYHRSGKLVLDGKAYRFALVDQAINGKFNDLKHGDDEPPKVTVLVDRNGDGKFDLKKEAFDASKPFRVGGVAYQVISIDVRGTHVALQQSSKSGKAKLTAADLKPGSDVIDFEVETMDGKVVHFPDDFKGRVVMLDFWATWSVPYQMAVGEISKVYHQYHKKGFDIVGVSLDQANQERLLNQAIREAGMTWAQIYDGGYLKAEIARLYGVNSLPFSILVDGDTGKIVAMDQELQMGRLAGIVEQALANLGKKSDNK